MTRSAFRRVTRERPCPICGRSSWCGFTADGSLVVCMREAEGALRQSANGGNVHRLRDRDPLAPRAAHRVELPARPADLAPVWRPRLETSWRRPRRLEQLLGALGLHLDAGQQLLAFEYRGVLHVPGQDEARRWVAIQYRTNAGEKFYARGEGEPKHSPAPFVPLPLGDGRIFIVEGFSDACALAGLGLIAIGRTTAKPGRIEIDVLRHYVRGRDVVVIGENDLKTDGKWPGKDGALDTAHALLLDARSVRIAFPPEPFKDARDWCRSGASRDDVERAIAAAEPMHVELAARGGVHD